MTKLTLSFSRAAIVALTLAGGAGLFLASSSTPADALCKYGSPNCVNPNPGPKPPKVNDNRIPDSNWIDPDCKHYGNCHGFRRQTKMQGPGKQQGPGKFQTFNQRRR